MSTCKGCKYAEWYRTANGKLHSNGLGRCTFKPEMPKLPESMYWISSPHIGGGFISRKESFDQDCPVRQEEGT